MLDSDSCSWRKCGCKRSPLHRLEETRAGETQILLSLNQRKSAFIFVPILFPIESIISGEA